MRRDLGVLLAVAGCAAVLVAAFAVAEPSVFAPSTVTAPSSPSGGHTPPPSSPPPSSNQSPPAGNQTPPQGNGSPPASNSTVDNLTLSAIPGIVNYTAGETVALEIRLTNIGAANMTVYWGGCNPWLVVTNASGAVVYDQAEGICPQWVGVGTLLPGQSWYLNLSWNQEETNSGRHVPVPGVYDVVAYWAATSGPEPLSAGTEISIAGSTN